MRYESQKALVQEIAGLLRSYRDNDQTLVKFGLKCGLALNKLPVVGGIMMSPKTRDERFKIDDPAYREHHSTEKEAFYAAFDAFAANADFLAWNGKSLKEGKFDLVKEMSDDFTRPTMSVEVIYRKRGHEHEEKLSMFFVGFNSEDAAKGYVGRHAHLVM